MKEELKASGGLCAPVSFPYGPAPKRGDLFYVTYRVRNPIRRWWWRRNGWSTEWTVEHVYVPIIDLIPRFTASRGGIHLL